MSKWESQRASGQSLMAWAVGNARVEPKGNAILVTKQASGSAKIDPLMAAFNAIALMSTTLGRRVGRWTGAKATTGLSSRAATHEGGRNGRVRQSFSGAGVSTGSL